LLTDKIGARLSLRITAGIIALGSVICAFSGILSGKSDYSSDSSYYIMLTGRFIYAIGAETAGIA